MREAACRGESGAEPFGEQHLGLRSQIPGKAWFGQLLPTVLTVSILELCSSSREQASGRADG